MSYLANTLTSWPPITQKVSAHARSLFPLSDACTGIYTLPVLLGDRVSRIVAQLLLLAQYGVLAHLLVTEQCSRWALVAFAAFPMYLRAAALFAHEKPANQAAVRGRMLRSVWPNYFAAIAFEHNAVFGAAFVGALVFARLR